MTFSIVARDPETGALGVATATGGPCVGVFVPHARSNVGAIATQGDTNPFYGVDGLDLLAAGMPANQALERLVDADAGRESRQVLAIGSSGPAAVFTGASAIQFAGSIAHDTFAVAGNMIAGEQVIESMASAFEMARGALVDRLIAALGAGEAEGGDVRGIKSAALLIHAGKDHALFDCRVDLSITPVADLAKLVAATRTGGYADFVASRPTRHLATVPTT